MRLALAADHAGYEMKSALAEKLKTRHEILDLGAFAPSAPDDYPDYARAIGNSIRTGQAERGILICGSGVGASVAANKMKGIRAGLCHDVYSAHQGVEHDDMNVLVLGSRIIGPALAAELADAFINAKFTHEERHIRRLNKVKLMETEG